MNRPGHPSLPIIEPFRIKSVEPIRVTDRAKREECLASARNNLGVAYEQAGQFDLADDQYQRALELDSNNMYIRQNFELFREAYEKRKRKSGDSTP